MERRVLAVSNMNHEIFYVFGITPIVVRINGGPDREVEINRSAQDNEHDYNSQVRKANRVSVKQPEKKQESRYREDHDDMGARAQPKEKSGHIEMSLFFGSKTPDKKKNNQNNETILKCIDFSLDCVKPKGLRNGEKRHRNCSAQKRCVLVFRRKDNLDAFGY